MMHVLLITLFCLGRQTAAAGDWWDDFAGNLATDLAPFVSLFGEAPTKQFMSESLTFLDYVIFAMAPLGVLTTIVSVIRVCGGSSLRAFIGRSQEGMGAIEAELCSSTSPDVCELYKSGGGIARVMGRSKILEIVHNNAAEDEEFFDLEALSDSEEGIDKDERKGYAGLYPAQDYLVRTEKYSRTDQWEEIIPNWGGLLGYKRKTISRDDENLPKSEHSSPETFAPSPNLTLNIWMRRPPTWATYTAAIFGIALQASTIAFAAIVTYYLKYKKDDADVPAYGFPLMAAGTIALCVGIYLCAFLVGESTEERKFRRTDKATKTFLREPRPNFVWLQPGGQRIGDQTFDAFVYSDADAALSEYTTSWKALNHTIDAFDSGGSSSNSTNRMFETARTVDSGKHPALSDSEIVASAEASPLPKGTKDRTRRDPLSATMLFVALIFSVVGFIAQFVGLRALHSSISIMQFCALLVMSFVRSLLRSRRMDPSSNRLEGVSNYVQGHELTWLALDLAKPDIDREDKMLTNTESYLVSRPIWIHTPFNSSEASASKHFLILLRGNTDWDECRAKFEAARGARVIVYGSTQSCHPPFERELCGSRPSLPRKIFMLRKRLAHLTSESPLPTRPVEMRTQPSVPLPESMRSWSVEQVSIRDQVSALSLAICQTANVLFSGDSKFSLKWKEALSFQWVVGCSVIAQQYHTAPICLKIWRKSTTEPWECDKFAMEAILSLCVWSLHADRRMERKEGASRTRSSRAASIPICCLISFNKGMNGGLSHASERLWIKRSERATIKEGILSPKPATQNSAAAQEHPAMTLSPWDLFRVEKSGGGSKFLPLSYHPSAVSNTSAVVRAFGWNAAGELGHRSLTKIKFVASELSMAQMYAQEIFASFIQALFSTVERIGGTSDLEQFGVDEFQLKNTEISKILQVFTDSNLGSQRDALFTTLPAIGSAKLRSLELIAELSRRRAHHLRQQGYWAEAFKYLNTIYRFVKKFYREEDEALVKVQCTLYVTLLEHLRMCSNLRKLDLDFLWWIEELKELLMEWNSGILRITEGYEAAIRKGATLDHNSSFLLTGNLQEDLVRLGHPGAQLSRNQLSENLILAATLEWDISEARLAEEVSRVIIETLLELGADPNHEDETSDRTSISYAAEKGREQVVVALLEAGAKIKEDRYGRCALHYASIKGHIDVVRVLLQDGNSVISSRDMYDCTPLIYAAVHKHMRIVELLIHSSNIEDINANRIYLRDVDPAVLNGSTHEEIEKIILRGSVYWRLQRVHR